MQIRVFFFANKSLFFCEKSLVRVESFYKGALEVQGMNHQNKSRDDLEMSQNLMKLRLTREILYRSEEKV